MLSSRDPQFRRPDVAERLLPLHFEKLASYRDENSIYSELERRRPGIMGAFLNRLAKIADALPRIEAPAMPFRMADYAAFGWCVFRATSGQEADWLALLKRIEAAQAEFAGEGDGLIETLRVLFERDGKIGPVESGKLFEDCIAIATERGSSMPRTPSAFGQKLTNMRRVIELEFGAKFIEDRGHQRRRTVTIEARS